METDTDINTVESQITQLKIKIEQCQDILKLEIYIGRVNRLLNRFRYLHQQRRQILKSWQSIQLAPNNRSVLERWMNHKPPTIQLFHPDRVRQNKSLNNNNNNNKIIPNRQKQIQTQEDLQTQQQQQKQTQVQQQKQTQPQNQKDLQTQVQTQIQKNPQQQNLQQNQYQTRNQQTQMNMQNLQERCSIYSTKQQLQQLQNQQIQSQQIQSQHLQQISNQ